MRAASSEQREPPKRPDVVSFYLEERVEHRGLKSTVLNMKRVMQGVLAHPIPSSTFDPG